MRVRTYMQHTYDICIYGIHIPHIYIYRMANLRKPSLFAPKFYIYICTLTRIHKACVCVCVIMWVIMCVITCAREFIFYVLSVHVNMFYVQSVIESCIHK